MRTTLSILGLILISFIAKANLDCVWTVKGKGITVSYLAPCEDKHKEYLDSVFQKILQRTRRIDTTVKILVLVNNAPLSYPGGKMTYFKSLGIDTLRSIDQGSISDFYFTKEKQSVQQHNGLNYYKSRMIPLDINYNPHDTSRDIGIKIIYKTNPGTNTPNWTDIEDLIRYAVSNKSSIEKLQRRDTVNFDYNNWYLSLVTLDTFQINSIIRGKSLIGHAGSIGSASNKKLRFGIYCVVCLITIGLLCIWLRRTCR